MKVKVQMDFEKNGNNHYASVTFDYDPEELGIEAPSKEMVVDVFRIAYEVAKLEIPAW